MYEVSNYMDELNNDKSELSNNLELPKALEISQNFERLMSSFEDSLLKSAKFF